MHTKESKLYYKYLPILDLKYLILELELIYKQPPRLSDPVSGFFFGGRVRRFRSFPRMDFLKAAD